MYINLDPAATDFAFEPDVDIQDLISLDDAMTELRLGPNGGLLACFDFLLENLDWLDEALGPGDEETLHIIDCPGQIELYTHTPILPTLARHLRTRHDFSLCATYLLESTFVIDRAKFVAGTLSAMSAMLLLEMPHLNVLSKMDLLRGQMTRRELKRFITPDSAGLAEDVHADTNPKFHELNQAIVRLIDDFSMVQFLQLEAQKEDSVQAVLSYIDNCIGWSEVQEPKIPDENLEYDPTGEA